MTKPTALDTALVPIHEHPYPIPNNWLWVYLPYCYQNITSSNKKIEKKLYNERGLYPIIDQGQSFIAGYSDNEELAHHIKRPVILFGDHTRCIKYIDFPFIQGADGVKILSPSKVWNPKLFYFAMMNLEIPSLGYRRHSPIFSTLPLPLPPLEEQARIVAIIEKLFTQLDDAKAILEDICASFDDRKSAILHQAFTGKLTQQWRDERGISLDEWQQKTLGEVCEINPPKIKTADLSDQLEVSFVPMTCVSDTYGKITEFRTEPLKKVKQGYTNFTIGDVLFAKITPCMENGKIAVVDSLVNNIGYGSTEFYVFRCNETEMFNKYLYYFIRNTVFRKQAREVMAGAVGQQRVPKYYLENYRINLPSIEEQQEIVRVLDSLLSMEDQFKNSANQLEQIDILKKTILAKAFRGELNTNNPGEPSCEELLKQVLEAPAPKKERK